MRRQRYLSTRSAHTPLLNQARLLTRHLRRVAPMLLAAGMLAISPAQAADPVVKPTVKKPSVAKPTVSKPSVSKPAGNKAKSVKSTGKPRKPVVAGVTVASAAALALGTAVAPALPAGADQGVRNLEAKAREGDIDSQMALAEHLASGTPPEAADMRRAIYWYGQAAAKGDADACWTLAELFRGDLGVPPDLEMAADWYRKAAELGHAEAAFDLGLLYMEGYGLERDPAQAAAWFEQAADAGIARAHYMLGALFEQGVDGAPDREAAAGWYARAAESGDVNARAALVRLAAGEDNVVVAEGPPPGMLGGPPGGAARSTPMAAVSHGGTGAGSQAGGAAIGARPVAVDQGGVKEIQAKLAKLGYHKGKADGFLGKRTVAAIRAYQKSAGLRVDGKASQALLEKLRRS